MGAPQMSKVVPLFHARNIVALSATPERDDGCTNALLWMFGPIAFRCKRPWQHIIAEVVKYTSGPTSEITYRNGELANAAMMERLTKDGPRNTWIVTRTLKAVADRRRVIILTERTEHIDTLRTMLLARNADMKIGVIQGSLKDAERDTVLATVYDGAWVTCACRGGHITRPLAGSD